MTAQGLVRIAKKYFSYHEWRGLQIRMLLALTILVVLGFTFISNYMSIEHSRLQGGLKSEVGVQTSTAATVPFSPLPPLRRGKNKYDGGCEASVVAKYTKYAAEAAATAKQRERRGLLRIVAFSRLWIPPIHPPGGMQYHAFHLYSQLAARGHYVHVLVAGPPYGEGKKLRYCTDTATHKAVLCKGSEARLIVEQVPSKRNGEYSVMWHENCLETFRRYNAKIPFDVVHSESWAGVVNIYQMGLPFVVTWHGSMLDWFRNELNFISHNYRIEHKMPEPYQMRRMQSLAVAVSKEAYMLLTVPQHIVISDAAEHDLVEMQHVDRERVALIYNGVNSYMFRPRDEEGVRDAFLKKHKVPRDHFVVGCGGRLDSIKGHFQLSIAMELIMKNHTDVTLLVSGHGGEGWRYRAMRGRGLSVVELGMLSQETLAQFYQSIDVFVDPFYQHHGLNTVMIEAALSGVPLVVTDLGGARSVVPCEDYGRLFTVGDVEGLAREILFYKFHPEVAKATAHRARERALRLFDKDIMASQYESVFYRAMDSPRPSVASNGRIMCETASPIFCYREV